MPEDRPPLSPQLAVRVAVVGTVALAVFAVIFFRLWFLQVLSGDQYVASANQNTVRDIAVPAQRGQILDNAGNILVDSRASTVVQIAVPLLPKSAGARARELNHLADVAGISTRSSGCRVLVPRGRKLVKAIEVLTPIECQIREQQAALPYADVTVAKDVPRAVFLYLNERTGDFPGVRTQQVFVRNYPYGSLAAQLLGTVGPISPSEVKQVRYRGVPKTAVVGQSGVDQSYDHYLRGTDGATRVEVNSLGSYTSSLAERKPVSGHDLKLSLDLKLQRAGEAAVAQAISNSGTGVAGAFVALDPENGRVLAMGSNPTYNANDLVPPVKPANYVQLTASGSGFPLDNRAIAGNYPTGSTFKAITATAALQSGAWSVGRSYDDTGSFTEGAITLHNAGMAANGPVDIVNAIRVSSDTFFYNLGARMNVDPTRAPNGGQLQTWARRFGIGQPTGIDVAGEATGILPTPIWRDQNNRRELAYEAKHHVACCTLGYPRPWSVGDNVNLAVGQGDLEATPLQLAVAYSAIENGRYVVRPHVGLEVEAPDGTVLQTIDPPPARRISIDPVNLAAVRDGLRAAASQPGGTSYDVFNGFAPPVHGKTGTAQHNNQSDQSWYVCYVPAWNGHRAILVAVTVEQGGFGAAAAAPAAREILNQYFYGNRGAFVAGKSTTR